MSDLTWTSVVSSWGPVEKDRSNGEAAGGDGRPITLNGVVYPKGLGTHATSDIRYSLGGAYAQFTASVGVDDEAGGNGSVVFQVWTDGTQRFTSGVMTGSSPTQAVAVPLTGVNELRLVVTDAGDGIASDHADWADAYLQNGGTSSPTPAGGTVTYLSDLPWTAVSYGYGPVEKDRSNGGLGSADGGTITLNGQAYAKGLGTNAPSDILYLLAGTYSSFTSDIGVDDEVGALGSVTFEVWTDGVKRYDSGLMTGASATKQISLPMTGVNQLRLVVTDGGDGRAADHADWAGAQLRSLGPSVGTPTALPNGPNANPSGQSMPVGDLPGWRQIFAEDFTTDAPVGSFPGSAYGSRWDVYPDGAKDTAGAQGGPSRYYPSKVLGVGGGVLTKYLHTENGIPLSAAILPKAGGKYLDQLYGKYTVRYRAESVHGFRVAWMLWPQSNVWPRDGEINFPETGLDGYMCGFVHHQDGTPYDQYVACTGVPLGNNLWHTASIEWSPDRVDFILDGVTVGSSFSRIPNTPMHWVLQTEACYDVGCPDPTTVGKIEIDWAVIYAKAN